MPTLVKLSFTLPFLRTSTSIANSSGHPASPLACARDVRRTPCPGPWRIPVRARVRRHFRDGNGQDRRTGRRSTESAMSNIPGRREPPPLSTIPPTQISSMPLWRRLSRSISKSSRARGLQNFSDHALRNQARRTVSNGRNFDFVAFGNQRDNGVAEEFLDLLRFRQPGCTSRPKDRW